MGTISVYRITGQNALFAISIIVSDVSATEALSRAKTFSADFAITDLTVDEQLTRMVSSVKQVHCHTYYAL